MGYAAIESPHCRGDLHSTILHQLGLAHKRMAFPVLGGGG
ncbi:MAG: DUF1501 domain-containing protein [Paludisphaera borealis]|nr:DUF1501 domain-containing protein [Paludisphaera borealis]